MVKKILAIFVLFFVFTTTSVYAQDTAQNDQKTELQNKINEYQKKLDELRVQKGSLGTQIKLMDTKIYLAQLKIQETEQKIKSTQKEIELLTARIDGLDESLNKLSKTLIERVVSGYKNKSVSFFDIFFNSANASEIMNQYQYAKIARENNQKILVHVQEAKLNFEEQKTLREKKKEELNQLTVTLQEQQVSLNTQKQDKQRLLEVTKNDENTYQKLLAEAQRQLSSFKSFVTAAGGGAVGANAFGTGSDGWYYTQRDARWAYQSMGASNMNVLEVGCLITDIAMLMKKSGIDWTPSTLAGDTKYFFSNTAYMLHPSTFSWPNGQKYVNIDKGQIDAELSSRPVIVGLNAGAYGSHYVVLKAKEGDDYIMHDPYYGPDKKFSSYYSKGAIFVAAVFK